MNPMDDPGKSGVRSVEHLRVAREQYLQDLAARIIQDYERDRRRERIKDFAIAVLLSLALVLALALILAVRRMPA